MYSLKIRWEESYDLNALHLKITSPCGVNTFLCVNLMYCGKICTFIINTAPVYCDAEISEAKKAK